MFETARFLAGRGHETTVYANQWQEDAAVAINYQFVPMRPRPEFLSGYSFFSNCTKRLSAAEFDVFSAHGCICPLGGVHWVQSVQAAWLERCREVRPPFSAGRVRQRLNPLHPVLLRLEERHFRARNYKKLVATTTVVRDDLHRLYGVPLEDIELVPNGFSPAEFNPLRRLAKRKEERSRLNLDPGHIALLFVANELDRKGFSTLLSAMAELRDPRIRLLVVGRSDVRRAKALATAAGLRDRVLLCGSTADVAAYHAAADLFVLPTQYEAFCLAILEALGSGLPVVTTKVPGARDAIIEGVNGFTIHDPRSAGELAATLRPMLDAGARDPIAAGTSSSVEQYQWPNVLGRYESILLGNCTMPAPVQVA